PLDNMKVTLLAACFIPGGYYEDIKGALLWNDAYASLDKADQLKLTTANYGMGDDVSCLFGAKFEYEF
ncbi:hypothetical protein HOD08_03515, partial [bacterium]|nr:hypothetical protein [bacterium]